MADAPEGAPASAGAEGSSGGADVEEGRGREDSSTSSGSDPLDRSDSSTSDDLLSDDDDDKSSPPTDDPTALLTSAMTLKEDGNAAFKSGELDKAARLYRKGASTLKPLNRGNSGDDQVKALLLTLHTNLSTVCFKQNKLRISRDVASKALEVDPNHVKALFRRAAARRKMGDDEEARADLRAALKVDPSNAAVKRELMSLKKGIEGKKKAEKERLRKAFGGKTGGSFLYEDKEAEERRKVGEKRKKKEEEERAKAKRKKEWEDECVRRMSFDEDPITFEDWEKDRKKKEEEEEKERKSRRKEEEDRRKAEQKAAREARRKEKGSDGNSSDEGDDDHGLTKSELEAMRGYKKTSDGRTTSYFNRELSTEQKAMIGDIAPQRLGSSSMVPSALSTSLPAGAADSSQQSSAPVPGAASPSGSTTASAWNRAGTWEEKDTSEWCTSCLRRHLSGAAVALPAEEGGGGGGSYSARVSEVKDLTGDASVALAGGRKRYIFDYHVSVKYEVVFHSAPAPPSGEGGAEAPAESSGEAAEATPAAPEEKVVASGTLKLPEINSGAAHEVEVDVPGTWKKAPRDGHVEAARECRERMVAAVREGVTNFVSEFNGQY
uniref:peptidylprolyl isomerase n=1 Tax=Odontella aurita TaxID=265563 RepID=A0A7S4HHM3_9STRA